MRMPEPDLQAVAKRAWLVEQLRAIVPGEAVIDHDVALRAYESDGLSAYRGVPMAVVLPARPSR